MDIVLNDDSKSWLITGFFTPNYRELAEPFAASLRDQGHPHHLFAVERSGTWNYETMRKPAIALAALDAYPKKTVILMDVDCTVNGALDELVGFNPAVDVACFMYVKTKKIGRHRQRTSLSSRVVLLRPTAGARTLLENWRDACVERPWMHGDEPNMMLALARSSGTAFSPIPLGFSGREIDSAPPGAVITHDSASHQGQNPRSFLKQLWHTVGASRPVDVAPKAERREREHS
mgnify:CR=1 FL=1